MKPDFRYRMKNKTYVFHTDPGHGWLAVKKRELTELQIMGEISPGTARSSAALVAYLRA